MNQDFYTFFAIAREQNITKAAETLFVTQSTLSKQMINLEKQLGKQLFIRGKRKITLTEEGTFLRNRAQEILELMDNTESAFHADAEYLTGDISIGCGETIAMDKIADSFTNFHARYPDVKFHTHSGRSRKFDRYDTALWKRTCNQHKWSDCKLEFFSS